MSDIAYKMYFLGRKKKLNSGHKVGDKYHKNISKLKCDASNKQDDDDDSNSNSNSDKTEQFAKINAMQSLNENLQSIGVSPTKKKKRLREGK
jgi:hypothetical protein